MAEGVHRGNRRWFRRVLVALGAVLVLASLVATCVAAWVMVTFAPVSDGHPWWSQARELAFDMGVIDTDATTVIVDIDRLDVDVPYIESEGWSGLRVSPVAPTDSFVGVGSTEAIDSLLLGTPYDTAHRDASGWTVTSVPGVAPVLTPGDLESAPLPWHAKAAALAPGAPALPVPATSDGEGELTVLSSIAASGDRRINIVFTWPQGGRVAAVALAVAVACALVGAVLIAVGWGSRRRGRHRAEVKDGT